MEFERGSRRVARAILFTGFASAKEDDGVAPQGARSALPDVSGESRGRPT